MVSADDGMNDEQAAAFVALANELIEYATERLEVIGLQPKHFPQLAILFLCRVMVRLEFAGFMQKRRSEPHTAEQVWSFVVDAVNRDYFIELYRMQLKALLDAERDAARAEN
jgi:hypothetical protein